MVMRFSDLECCPFCGNDEYYEKQRIVGYGNYFYSFDGSEVDNSTLHDGLSYYSTGRVYCSYCEKYLGNIETGEIGVAVAKKLKVM